MCDEAVDDFVATLKLILDWFVTSKIIKNFLLLCNQIKIYPILMKILVMLFFLVMKWIALTSILMLLTLIIILMKMI